MHQEEKHGAVIAHAGKKSFDVDDRFVSDPLPVCSASLAGTRVKMFQYGAEAVTGGLSFQQVSAQFLVRGVPLEIRRVPGTDTPRFPQSQAVR
jgi:hypothetical protein